MGRHRLFSLALAALLAGCAAPASAPQLPATPSAAPTSPPATATVPRPTPPAPAPTSPPSATPRPTLAPPTRTSTAPAPTRPVRCPGAPPITLRVGQTVMVSLDLPTPSRVREAPGRASALVGEVGPGEFVVVEAGPECADGDTWWKVRSEKGLAGWTVEGDVSGYWLVTPTPPPGAAPPPALRVALTEASPLAGGLTQTTVPACLDPNDCFRVLPAYASARVEGYPLSGRFNPEFRIYPAGDYERLVTSLEPLRVALAAQDTAYRYGYWLVVNAAQVLQAQPRFLAFQNGAGVRVLAHFAQATWPLNNGDLTYVFVGLTADGGALVTLTLPVHAASLPDDGGLWQTGGLPPIPTPNADYSNAAAILDAILAFNIRAAAELETLEADAFTPSLDQLDALVGALRVGP